MGIIDHNGKVLPCFDPLESSRNIDHRLDPFAYHIRRQPLLQPDGDGSQCVIDVVFTHQPALHQKSPGWGGGGEARSGKREADILSSDIRPTSNGIGPEGNRADLAHAATPRIIRIDNGAFGTKFVPGGSQIREQAQFCLEVIFHVGMEIEVVLGQVRIDRHIEFAASDAIQGKRVRGHFHHRGVQTGRHHARQQGLELACARCRMGCSESFRPDLIGHRSDHTHPPPSRLKHRFAQIGHRGLSVCPGHTDHRKPKGGILVKPAGQ